MITSQLGKYGKYDEWINYYSRKMICEVHPSPTYKVSQYDFTRIINLTYLHLDCTHSENLESKSPIRLIYELDINSQ